MSCESETVTTLRGSGHKMTPQRMMILTSLRHAQGHLTAAAIFERVKQAYPYVDISTVYRTLTVLKEMRLISETHMGDGDAAFTKATGMTLDLTGRGMGLRSCRYSMLVKDGKVASLNVEAPGKFEVSDAATLLAQAKA